MSDLTATQCGCDHNSGSSNGCNSFIWIILLSCLCGGNGNTCSGGFGCGSNDGNGCNLIIWIILLSCLCGNGSNGLF